MGGLIMEILKDGKMKIYSLLSMGNGYNLAALRWATLNTYKYINI